MKSPRPGWPTRLSACCAAWLFAVAAPAQEATNGLAFGDFLLVPLRVHLLTATNEPAIHTTLTSNDVTRILGKANRIWAQAGITFPLESLRIEAAVGPTNYLARAEENERATLLALRPQDSLATNCFHVFYLKRIRPNGVYFNQQGIFVKDTANLRRVEGGLDESIPRVTSHELGHALSLGHRQNITNLMASGTSGPWLNADEIKWSREAARQHPWVEPAGEVLRRAEELQRAGRTAEARVLWQRLAAVPLDNETTRRIRRLLAGEPAR
jgi:hypothetical protein